MIFHSSVMNPAAIEFYAFWVQYPERYAEAKRLYRWNAETVVYFDTAVAWLREASRPVDHIRLALTFSLASH